MRSEFGQSVDWLLRGGRRNSRKSGSLGGLSEGVSKPVASRGWPLEARKPVLSLNS